MIRITEVASKPVPVTVSVDVDAPAATVAGLSDVRLGTGFVTVKEYTLELPPPGEGAAGFTTIICSVPALATSFAGMVASKVVVLTKEVGSGVFPTEM